MLLYMWHVGAQVSCIRKVRISQYTQHLARYIESSLPSTTVACAACRLRGIKLGNFDFCSSPLQLGSLRGNTFRILMRDVNTHDEDHVSFTITPSVDPAPDRRFCMGFVAPPLVPQIHWQCSPLRRQERRAGTTGGSHFDVHKGQREYMPNGIRHTRPDE